MQIIFEGADTVGKSTLARALAREMQLPIRGRITRAVGDPFEACQKDWDIETKDNVILDRCYYISDMVYEPIYNGQQSRFASNKLHWDIELYHPKRVVVYVTCDDSAMRTRYQEVGDELYDFKQIQEAKRRYKEFFAAYRGNNLVCIDTTTKSVEENIRTIMWFIRAVDYQIRNY